MGTKQYERIFQILGAVLLAAVVVGVIAVCFGNGARSGVKREIGACDYYSQEEISAAMDTAQEYFDDHFPGCVMTSFRYDEESVREAEPEWADQYQADQAIVLLSDFQTDKHGGDGSLNPNEIYQDWQWVLVRSGNGDWTLKTCGY